MDKDPKSYCFMALKDLACIKTKVAKKHLAHYECEKCIWRIHSHTSRELESLEKVFQKYGDREWT